MITVNKNTKKGFLASAELKCKHNLVLENGINLRDIQSLLGHTKTTKIHACCYKYFQINKKPISLIKKYSADKPYTAYSRVDSN